MALNNPYLENNPRELTINWIQKRTFEIDLWTNEHEAEFQAQRREVREKFEALKDKTSWLRFGVRRRLNKEMAEALAEHHSDWENQPMIKELNWIFDHCPHRWSAESKSPHGPFASKQCSICGLKETRWDLPDAPF